MHYPEMTGTVAMITGAGKGLGLAIAEGFTAQGVQVAICDIDTQAGRSAADAIKSRGGQARFVATDVADASSVDAAVTEIHDAFGRIDFLVNNAAISQRVPLREVTVEDFDRIMAVNVRGPWLGIKAVAPLMIEAGGGCVVNISSTMGLVAQAGVSTYAASKHAVLGLTKAAAIELGRQGVRVNAVAPGRHDTPMIRAWRPPEFTEEQWQEQILRNHPATGRIGQPGEIAASVLFLCSAGASNIHGTVLPVDGGWTAQ